MLFSSVLKYKNIKKKKYQDCIKYTCIFKCMNLPKRVKTIISTLKLYKLSRLLKYYCKKLHKT